MALDVMKRGASDFVMPDPIPPGNWLAHQIRIMQENSPYVMPESAGSKRTWDKYNSMTHKDFCGPRDWEEYMPDFNVMPFEKKRQTVKEILFCPTSNQKRYKIPPYMFNSWRVPERFYSPDAVDFSHDVDHRKFSPEPEISNSRASSHVRASPHSARSASVTRSPVPKVTRQMSAAARLNSSTSNDKVPDMKPRKGSRPLGVARQYTKLPDMQKSSPEPLQVRRSVTNIPDNGGEKLGKQELENSLQPEVVAKAEEFMKLAPNTDRKVIEKILRMADRKKTIETSLRRTLLPDAKESVEKWLQGANDEERQVAIKFFNSLAGSRLMGMTAAEQKKRLKQVIDTLETGSSTDSKGKPQAPLEKAGHLKTFRLLSPQTRKDRMMHTTWHHLPEQRTSEQGNWSSHYIRPQAPIPRHFVIHPDWG